MKTPRHSEGQGSQVCCSPWGHKQSDTTERLNNKQDSVNKVQIDITVSPLSTERIVLRAGISLC